MTALEGACGGWPAIIPVLAGSYRMRFWKFSRAVRQSRVSGMQARPEGDVRTMRAPQGFFILKMLVAQESVA